MSVQSLCLEPHRLLRGRARPVERFTDDIRRLSRDLMDTMYAHDGIGIAAPQIGHAVQLFVANPSQQRGRELVLVNPILTQTEGRSGIVEGCLSVPDTWERVWRAAAVRMTGCDPFGQPLAVEATGLLAIVLQHEFDHLHGTLFIDRVPWYRRYRVWRKPWCRRRASRACV